MAAAVFSRRWRWWSKIKQNQVEVEYTCCKPGFFINIVIVVLLAVFAGLMSGLTLGLMSMSLFDLEVLVKFGTPKDL